MATTSVTDQKDKTDPSVLSPVPQPRKRDRAVDILRGWFIVMMITSHTSTYTLSYQISHLPYYLSAAGGFVFLSGMVLGMVYKRRIEKEGEKTAYSRLLRRAATIAVVHYLMTFAWALMNEYTNYFHWIPRSASFGGWPRLSMLILTFQYQPIFLNILPMYVFFLAASPIFLCLLRRKAVIPALGLSLLFYLAVIIRPQIDDINQPCFGGESFHLFAWQLLFFSAMYIGYFKRELIEIYWRTKGKVTLRAALVYFAVLFILALFMRNSVPAHLHPFSTYWSYYLLDRPTVRPLRVLYLYSGLLLAYSVLHGWEMKGRLARPLLWLEELGQRSLYCFQLHIIFVYALIYSRLYQMPHLAGEFFTLLVIVVIFWMSRLRLFSRVIPN